MQALGRGFFEEVHRLTEMALVLVEVGPTVMLEEHYFVENLDSCHLEEIDPGSLACFEGGIVLEEGTDLAVGTGLAG
tara:strand:+ start:607 stop:837 length:231 start_codon:yes stop_codon:yes gene_type:complete